MVAVWARWQLDADCLVEVLGDSGVRAEVVVDPVAYEGLLVAMAVLQEDLPVLEARERAGRPTVVWGGTLPVPRVAQLREAGAAAYVPMLQPPRELVAVVSAVLGGEEVPWEAGPGPMSALTSREQGVARAYLVEHGDRARSEVADLLGITDRTLKVHIANIRAKAGHRGTHTREGLRRALTVRGWLT